MISRLFFGTFVIAITAACSSTSDPSVEDDTVLAVPFASTKMLSASDLDALVPETGDGRLVFSRPLAILADVRAGSVLVGGLSASSPRGLLRVVTSVERQGDRAELRTVNAPIQLAFRKLTVATWSRATGEIGSMAWPAGDASRATRSGAMRAFAGGSGAALDTAA
jgi:hypothetical protein